MVQINLKNKEELTALELIKKSVPFLKSDHSAVRYALAETAKKIEQDSDSS